MRVRISLIFLFVIGVYLYYQKPIDRIIEKSFQILEMKLDEKLATKESNNEA